MKKIRIIPILIISFVILFMYFSYAFNLPKWFPFNEENALNDWQEKIIKNKVLYVVEPKYEGGYLSAKSDKACSGLIYKIKFNLKKLPMISWKWKVIKFPEKAKPADTKSSWVEKDDYAARVYIIFPSWYFMHMRCIEYLWDENLPEGTVMTSPYWHNIKLIVAESGRKKMGQWVFEERNIYEDYKKAFGRAPPAYVGAIALMTDTDNTLSTA